MIGTEREERVQNPHLLRRESPAVFPVLHAERANDYKFMLSFFICIQHIPPKMFVESQSILQLG